MLLSIKGHSTTRTYCTEFRCRVLHKDVSLDGSFYYSGASSQSLGFREVNENSVTHPFAPVTENLSRPCCWVLNWHTVYWSFHMQRVLQGDRTGFSNCVPQRLLSCGLGEHGHFMESNSFDKDVYREVWAKQRFSAEEKNLKLHVLLGNVVSVGNMHFWLRVLVHILLR